MHLKTLLAGLSLRSATADMETEITRISYDSRTTAPGDVFVAMTGFATDGHAYIGKAVAAGAAAVVCERPPEDSSVPYVLVENSRRALAVMAANYYGHPADSMTMVAVTGTNGKTTTTYLLKAILEQELGAKVFDRPVTVAGDSMGIVFLGIIAYLAVLVLVKNVLKATGAAMAMPWVVLALFVAVAAYYYFSHRKESVNA